MRYKKDACAECTRNCLLIHGKKDPSHIVTSFFKVMIGDNFSKVLFLPPRFARTVGDLVDKKIHLEDANGQHWEVTVSNLNGSLAFKKGWREFSLDHGVEVGDFLVFYYIKGSHFVVQIWGKSGCEKLSFSKENGNWRKRIKTSNKLAAEVGSCHAVEVNSMNKQDSSTSVISESDIEYRQSQQLAADKNSNHESENAKLKLFSAEYMEEPFYLLDRHVECRQGEDRTYLCDLSRFEMQKCRSDADGQNKVLDANERSPCHTSTIMGSQTEASLINRDLLDINVVSWEGPSNVIDHAMIDKNNYSVEVDEIALISERDFSSGHSDGHLLHTRARKSAEARNSNGNYSVLPSQKGDACMLDSGENFPLEFAGTSDFCGSSVLSSVLCQSGKEPMLIRECGESSNLSVKDNKIVYEVVKCEPVDSVDLFLPEAANCSLSVVIGSQNFLELPESLPSLSSRRLKLERKVVLLRDPNGRLWPVLYQEKYGLKVLTSGWEAFSKANGIQPGDECVVGVENNPECIYRFSIVHK